MPLIFHHFYVFTTSGAPVVDKLVSNGFTEGSGNIHPGQGTANRRIFFSNGMLEFIWVHSDEEARSPLTEGTRLSERARYLNSGYSPFGICICSTENSEMKPFEGWSYQPKYLPEGYEIWMAGNQDRLEEPSIFHLRAPKPFSSVVPANEPILHSNGARALRSISIELNGTSGQESDGLKQAEKVELLRFSRGPLARARIEIETVGAREELDLGAWCPVVIGLV